MGELKEHQDIHKVRARVIKLAKLSFLDLKDAYDKYGKVIEIAKDAGVNIDVNTGEINK